MGTPIYFAEVRMRMVEDRLAQIDQLVARGGEQGPQGDVGPPPRHEWRATELRFELPGNQWGPWVDLQGPRGFGGGGGPGPQGVPGRDGVGTGGGNPSQAAAMVFFYGGCR